MAETTIESPMSEVTLVKPEITFRLFRPSDANAFRELNDGAVKRNVETCARRDRRNWCDRRVNGCRREVFDLAAAYLERNNVGDRRSCDRH